MRVPRYVITEDVKFQLCYFFRVNIVAYACETLLRSPVMLRRHHSERQHAKECAIIPISRRKLKESAVKIDD